MRKYAYYAIDWARTAQLESDHLWTG